MFCRLQNQCKNEVPLRSSKYKGGGVLTVKNRQSRIKVPAPELILYAVIIL